MDVRVMNTKQRLVMLEMVYTASGHHSPHAVLHAKEESNPDLAHTHANLLKQKSSTAILILEHTTYGLHGQLAQRLAEEVYNHDDVIIHAVKMTKQKAKSVTQIQVHLVHGQHGAAALLLVAEAPRLQQEYTLAREKNNQLLRNVTHNLALSGVDGHSGDSAVQHVIQDSEFERDSVEVVMLVVVSA